MALNNLTRIGNSGFGTDTSINTTGIVTAASFSGDGSGLTGVTATGSGVVVQEEGSNVGTAQTINFVGTGVTATISGGIASVEISTSGGGGGGGLSNVVEDTTPQLGGNLDLNSNNITGTGDISITGDATFSGDLDVDGHVDLDNVSIAGVSTFTGTAFLDQLRVSGISTLNSIYIGDSDEIRFGAGSGGNNINPTGDFKIYHDHSNFHDVVYEGISGAEAIFQSNIGGVTNNAFEFKRNSNTLAMMRESEIILYSGGSAKFQTAATGAIVTGTLVATATTATNVTVVNEASDTECFVMFGVNATGDNAPKSSSSLKYNSSSGGLTAGSFIGDGSGLTGITASGSGVIVRDGGSLVGTAGTIDFGSNVSVSPISAGVVTVTASAGSIPGISTAQTTQLNNLTVAGVSTFNNHVTLGDDDEIKFGDDNDAKIKVDTGQNFILQGDGTTYLRGSTVIVGANGGAGGFETAIRVTEVSSETSQVELYYDNDLKLETIGAGVTVTGTTFSNQLNVSGISTFNGKTRLLDDVEFHVGINGSSGDYKFYRDSSNTRNIIYEDISGAEARLISNVGGDSNAAFHFFKGSNALARFSVNNVQLHSGGAVKLETTSTGVNITGTASATTFSGSGASLTTLNASELDSGTIPDARFPATLPAVSGANLTNLPAPTPADTDVQVTFDVSSNGSSAYRFTGPGYSGADDNPDIYLVRGQRYRFINGTGSGHPFRIQSDTSGTAYTDGVSGSQSGTQDFNVQHDAPARLYYQCTIHSGMIGNIYIVGGSDWRMTDVATNATPDIFTLNNVGIGTDNPNGDFEVFNSNQAVSIVRGNKSTLAILGDDSNTGASETDARIILCSDGTIANNPSSLTTSPLASHGFEIALINDEPGSGLRFHDGTLNKERLRIKSDGKVGIGTDNVDYKLEVFGTPGANGDFSIKSSASASSGTEHSKLRFRVRNASNQESTKASIHVESAANWGGNLIFGTKTSSGGLSESTVERLRITSGGDVGIGTDNPQSLLSLHQSGGGFEVNANSGSNNARLLSYDRAASAYREMTFQALSYGFETSGTERLRVDSSGRVTTPSQAAALVYKTGTNQTYSSDAIVNYDATSYSQGGMTINASRNRITVPVAGKYMITACASGSCTTASAGDGWNLKILRDGSTYNDADGYPIETTGSEAGQELAYTLSMVVDAAANDYFEIEIGNVGSARATISRGYFGIYLLG